VKLQRREARGIARAPGRLFQRIRKMEGKTDPTVRGPERLASAPDLCSYRDGPRRPQAMAPLAISVALALAARARRHATIPPGRRGARLVGI
jgi:hypothetical protein